MSEKELLKEFDLYNLDFKHNIPKKGIFLHIMYINENYYIADIREIKKHKRFKTVRNTFHLATLKKAENIEPRKEISFNTSKSYDNHYFAKLSPEEFPEYFI